MKIIWEHSQETEAKRIIHTAHQMAVGFYRLNGFFVLPSEEKLASSESNLVYLPDLNYTSIPRFWETARKTDVLELPIVADKKLVDQIVSLLGKTNEPQLNKTIDIWNKLEKEFFEELEKVIPDLKNSIKNLVVMPTNFGTKCSFNTPEKFPSDIVMYLRYDQDMVYGLVEGILSAVTRNTVFKKLDGSWAESEMLVDWLISESSIGKVVQKYHDIKYFSPTIKSTRVKQNANLLKKSDEFYKKLGLPSFEKPFNLENNSPKLFNKEINSLNESEKKILALLIEKSNGVITTDEVGKVIFKNEDDFSLYAIAKTIQRLRDKLEDEGISGSYIQTQRGIGYVLRN